jgi:hypothetical protein
MRSNNRHDRKTAALLFFITALGAGCAPDSAVNDPGEIGDDNGFGESAAGNGLPNSGNPLGGIGGNTRSVSDASADATCAAVNSEAKQIEVQIKTEVPIEVTEPGPVAIYLMLDQSESMTEASGSSTKWQVETAAVTSFVNDPASVNVDIAVQYFPLLLGDCTTGTGYNTPEVALGRLPDNAENVALSLMCHIPGIGGMYTPIEGALRGMTDFCIRYKQDKNANPDGEDCVGVLVTDGLPTQCNQDAKALIDIAAKAYTEHGVKTFTIGMSGADFNLLESIAKVGDGDCTPSDPNWTCDVSAGTMTFLDALNAIRGMVTTMKTRTEIQTKLETKKLDCNWAIPQPPKGETFDKDLVNVQFSPTGKLSDTATWGRVEYPSQCGNSGASWHYDNASKPAAIVACPKTCEQIKATDRGKIAITFGCKTVLTII